MSDEPRRPRRIEIPEEVAEAVALPEDLDSEAVGPYSIPDVAQRRKAGRVYVAAAVVTALGILGGLPAGMWVIVAVFLIVAGYHWLSGWHLEVRDGEALETANRATEFPVGHASAALSFEGWRSRPIWNVLVFSADDPPTQRGLVRVDGVEGTVIEQYVEAVPSS